jgi:hypothetical protein
MLLGIGYKDKASIALLHPVIEWNKARTKIGENTMNGDNVFVSVIKSGKTFGTKFYIYIWMAFAYMQRAVS